MPGFDGIKLDLSEEQTKDHVVLVCSFDVQQRPSRNCVVQLNRQADQLQDRGVTVVAVQALQIEQSALDKWLKEQGISIAVGTIEGDADRMGSEVFAVADSDGWQTSDSSAGLRIIRA